MMLRSLRRDPKLDDFRIEKDKCAFIRFLLRNQLPTSTVHRFWDSNVNGLTSACKEGCVEPLAAQARTLSAPRHPSPSFVTPLHPSSPLSILRHPSPPLVTPHHAPRHMHPAPHRLTQVAGDLLKNSSIFPLFLKACHLTAGWIGSVRHLRTYESVKEQVASGELYEWVRGMLERRANEEKARPYWATHDALTATLTPGMMAQASH